MQLKNVEDFYPLSPLQEGLLFHTLSDGEAGVYVSQLSCLLRGPLDVAKLERAWRRTAERHPALRTFFVWEGLKRPVQVVQRRVSITVEEHDWRALAAGEQEERVREYLAADARRAFDVSKAPLMRFALLRLADELHHFVWSHHHLLLDGWSGVLVSKEVFEVYEALAAGEEPLLPSPRPFRDYIVWLQKQDLRRAESFWRGALAGFAEATPLPGDRGAGADAATAQGTGYDSREVRLTVEETVGLRNAAARNGLTLNTVVQGVWAVLLAHYSGRTDVLFGATVSGRPPDLPEVERVVGMFINSLPARVRVDWDAPLGDWLGRLQREQLEARQYEYSPLAQVQKWSEVERGRPLFESILVFENYPVERGAKRREARLSVERIRHVIREGNPITVVAEPGEQLSVELKYDCRRFAGETMERLAENFAALLREVVTRPRWERVAALRESVEGRDAARREAEEKRLREARSEMLRKVRRRTVAATEAGGGEA